MDLKIDTSTGDVAIENGELVLLDGSEAIAQHLRVRLQFFLGEWFLDRRIGVPYYQKLLGQKPNTTTVKALMRQVIAATPGIETINDLTVDYDGATRVLSISFRSETSEGPLDFSEELIIG